MAFMSSLQAARSVKLMKSPVGIGLDGAEVYGGLVQGEHWGCGTPPPRDNSQGSGVLRYNAGAWWC
jgi:hypothetical protein